MKTQLRRFAVFPSLAKAPFKPYKFPLVKSLDLMAETPSNPPFHKQPWRRERKKPLMLQVIEQDPVVEEREVEIPNPRSIKSFLDQYVIGQEELKIALAVSIYNHYQRIEINSFDEETVIDKSNILLFGSTGTGKTLTAKTVANLLKVPFSMNDATCFTQAGYVGEDCEACISRLLQACGYDVEKAERGIVFIDEIDKISRRSDQSNPNQRDVSGEGVQQALLRMLEGTVVNVNVKPGTLIGKRVSQAGESFAVDTSNILFICSGAFIGLDKIVQDRLNDKTSIGFESIIGEQERNEQLIHPLEHVVPEDLIKFGFIPEFIGRIPSFASTRPLTEFDMREILVKPKNALVKQYERMFKFSNIDLLFSDQFLDEIAREAAEKQTGARGLRRIMENLLKRPLYEYAQSDIRKIEFLTPETHVIWPNLSKSTELVEYLKPVDAQDGTYILKL